MPTYIYECPLCLKQEDIFHSMSEVDNPSEETQIKTSCNESTCPCILEGSGCLEKISLGTSWKRVPTTPHLLNMDGGTTVSEKDLLKKKQKERSNRSKLHFKKEIMPKLPDSDKRRFEKSLSHIDTKKKLK